MPTNRVLLEFGTVNDWHGGDDTKAAIRAVEDAIHHCALPWLHTLHIDARTMPVEVTIGVQRPEKIDPERVKADCPRGSSPCTR